MFLKALPSSRFTVFVVDVAFQLFVTFYGICKVHMTIIAI